VLDTCYTIIKNYWPNLVCYFHLKCLVVFYMQVRTGYAPSGAPAQRQQTTKRIMMVINC
jgi:hypothetical protein